MKVIGAGLGRTGTNSLKLALEQLGLGPCHHMDEVLGNPPVQVPLWTAAVNGQPDWAAAYDGYASAVDWPTARFYRELAEAYPDAKFVLSVRSTESWVASFSSTIYKLLNERERVVDPMQPWIDMATRVVEQSGIPMGLDDAALAGAFETHNQAVRDALPAERLLVYEVKEGWGPLCGFLDVPVPAEPFPHTNDRGGFWDLVAPALK